MQGLRTRACERSCYRVADGHPDNAFVHVELRIRAGREPESKRRIGDKLYSVFCNYLAPIFDSSPLGLTFEIQEIDVDYRYLKSNLGDYVKNRIIEKTATHSRAQIHVELAEKEVAEIPDLPKDTTILPVNRVGILGAGTMGGGIAMTFVNAGIPVLLMDVEQAALDRGLTAISKNYENSVKRGRFSQQFVDERLKLITTTLAYAGFEDVDMVVEAVFEGMAVKKSVFGELDRVCKPGAILASNTSYMDIDEIATATSRPEAIVGTHFFSPANVMKLLEVVRGKKTSKEVIATCMKLSRKLGKIGVLVGNCRGFVGNRMFAVYRREAQFLIEEGASIETVDKALYNFGMAMGPLSVADLAGLDISWRMRKEFRHLQEPGVRQPILEDRLCEMNRFGQKTGAGWFKYDENRRAVSDPEVAELVRGWSADAGVPQRQISHEEIVDRCIYMLVNEGARILEEGYALRAGDIDVIYLNGYGFPKYRGGPMWYADTVGLKQVYQRTLEFQQQHGKLWQPAPLLERLAKEGKTFADYTREQTATV
jgi:3-hydroxyacyl-CoA dehydrogenase